MHTKLLVGSAVCLVLSAASGLWAYSLSDIPFGAAFSVAFNLTFIFLALALLGPAFVLFRSRYRWLGLIPALPAVAILIAQTAVQIDPRVIHFQGLPPSLSSEEWQADVQALVGEMEAKHADLFALVDRPVWDSVTSDIVSRVPTLDESAVVMELTRIAGLPKDGHTFPFIMAPCFPLHSYPIVLYGFPEGWHVVKAGRGLGDLVGTRLISINGHAIEKIYEDYPQLIAWENQQSRKEHFTYMAVMAEWLAYHGLIPQVGDVGFTFLSAEGDTIARTLSPVHFWPHYLWTGVFSIPNDEPAVFTNSREDAYTFRTLDGGKALYIQFNQCINQPGRETAKDFALNVERFVADNPVERCIIDLRNNDGGQRVYTELIRVIRDNPTLNRRGHLFVLIGRRTFSAAVMFTTELQLQTNALFIGEPTGQGPVFYSRPRLIELPNSGLMFAISSFHNVAGLPFDTRRAIEPDFSVVYGIDDFRSGRDPVLNAALSYEAPAASPMRQARYRTGNLAGRYLKDETLILDITETDEALTCRLTDAVPGTSVLFVSPLTSMENGSFATKVPNVSLRFGLDRSGRATRASVQWAGENVSFERTAGSYLLPFERLTAGDVAGACAMIRSDTERYTRIYPNLEPLLNQLGYQYLRAGETPSALQVFLLNVELYPLSSNVYDSYGEALMVNDQIDSSIASYTKSLELNPENANAARVIERLRDLQ